MGFLAAYPMILGYCQKAFRGCSDKEELTAEAVAIAYVGWLAIQKKGKTVSPLSITDYAVRRARSKRRTFSPDCSRDATRLRRVPVHPEFFLDLAGDSDPVEEAVLRVDFQAYLDTLPKLKRRACRMFLDGERTWVVARRLRVTPGRVSQVRRELIEGWISSPYDTMTGTFEHRPWDFPRGTFAMGEEQGISPARAARRKGGSKGDRSVGRRKFVAAPNSCFPWGVDI